MFFPGSVDALVLIPVFSVLYFSFFGRDFFGRGEPIVYRIHSIPF